MLHDDIFTWCHRDMRFWRGWNIKNKKNHVQELSLYPFFFFLFYLLVSQHKEVKKKKKAFYFLCDTKNIHLLKNDPYIHCTYMYMLSSLPLSVWATVPTRKSSVATPRMASSSSCILMTHLTPAMLMASSSKMTAIPTPRTAQAFSQPNVSATDSPKPVQYRAQATVWKYKEATFLAFVSLMAYLVFFKENFPHNTCQIYITLHSKHVKITLECKIFIWKAFVLCLSLLVTKGAFTHSRIAPRIIPAHRSGIIRVVCGITV